MAFASLDSVDRSTRLVLDVLERLLTVVSVVVFVPDTKNTVSMDAVSVVRTSFHVMDVGPPAGEVARRGSLCDCA